ncbi:MAG: hypothetical protein ACYSTL_01950, partial [Planctomycetota bacterium]
MRKKDSTLVPHRIAIIDKTGLQLSLASIFSVTDMQLTPNENSLQLFLSPRGVANTSATHFQKTPRQKK